MFQVLQNMTNLQYDCSKLIQIRKNGTLTINPAIIDAIVSLFKRLTKIENLSEATEKIKKNAKIKIVVKTPQFNQLISTPASFVRLWIKNLKMESIEGLDSSTDLVKGKYEGGFKVWESTRDLIDFLINDQEFIKPILDKNVKLHVLELGGGAALPTMAFLFRLFQDANFQSDYRVHIQDYNSQVLASLTLLNFAINFPIDYLKDLLETKCLRLISGDWKNFTSKRKYDLIYMSEVLYDTSNFESLHGLLLNSLTTEGTIVISTKNTYFGLTGGLYDWIQHVDSKQIFEISKVLESSTVGIPRSVLIMRRVLHN